MVASAARQIVRPGEDLAPGCAEGHAVQFYDDEAFLFEAGADFLAAGVEAGESLVVIATPAHAAGFGRALGARGFDVDALRQRGKLTLVDARETLGRFLVNGVPDADLFREAVTAILAPLRPAGIRAYGEMVDLLWEDGEPQAALQLEKLWNEMAEKRAISLLCAYAMRRFASASDEQAFLQICRAHSHVTPAEAYTSLDDPHARRREVALLQQRARALEAELKQRGAIEAALREALTLRDDFLSIAGHELKTPLTAVQLQTQSVLGMSGEDLSPRARQRMERIARQVGKLIALSDELLDVSRISTGKLTLHPEPCDLRTIVCAAMASAAPQAALFGCELHLEEGHPVPGKWDPARIEQVVANLLSNAVKYGCYAPVEITVTAVSNRARVAVRDHGIGIPFEDQPRVFRRFERAVSSLHYGGLGLGLWISRRIVEAHRGTIRVESEPGEGAAFTVELPFAAWD